MKLSRFILALGAACSMASASAAPIVLDFEGIASYPNNSDVLIQGYYNGGTASNGNSGPNLGIEFSPNALNICLNSLGVSCSNTSRGGLAPNSAQGALYWLSGGSTYMNVAAGFDTGFSFMYSDPFVAGAFIQVYDGLSGTGNLLATLNLGLTPDGASACPGYGANYCPFAAVGVGFAGTARSVVFGGTANYVVYDDITFGSVTPGGGSVPEPATLALLGLGALGIGASRRRKS